MMPNIWGSRLTLELLHLAALGMAYRKFRDPKRRQSGSDLKEFYERVWREAAEQFDARFEPLGDGIVDIVRDGVRVRAMGNCCSIEDPVTIAIAGNKRLTYRLLGEAGVRTPRHASYTFKTIGEAFAFRDAIGGDCVVKPAAGTGGGRGISTGISTCSQVARASAAASVYCDELMIEEQVEGDNYRLLYLDGKLLDAFVRKFPEVIGDGRSTIAALVKQANDERLREKMGVSQVLLTFDFDMKRTLARQGYSLHSVPAVGSVIRLKTVVNENRGVDNTTVTESLCPSIVEAGARAALALHVRFAGIDVITRDHRVPLEESGGVIIEVNTTPNFYYHYHKSDGCFPVALEVLEKLLVAPRGGAAHEMANLNHDAVSIH